MVSGRKPTSAPGAPPVQMRRPQGTVSGPEQQVCHPTTTVKSIFTPIVGVLGLAFAATALILGGEKVFRGPPRRRRRRDLYDY